MAAIDQFVRDYNGRWNVSFDGKPANAGQCVQAVALYCRDYLGLPIMWKDAAYWYYSFSLPNSYDKIPNTATAIPQAGDIIIWAGSLPNSGGAGHIAICVQPRPGTGTFVSFESNWGGKYCHLVTHNYDYVIGWLRPKVPASSVPAPQPEGDEMITTREQAIILYQMLRPNGQPSEDEINGTVNRRSFAAFLRDAWPEIRARDNNILTTQGRQAELQNVINQLNQTITDHQVKDSQTFSEYQTKIAELSAELSTAHDKLAEAQKAVVKPAEKPTPKPVPPAKGGFLTRLVVALLVKKKS